MYWHSSIWGDEKYLLSLERVRSLWETDPFFQELIYFDAESTFTERRQQEFPNKDLFVKRAIEDILDQCACVLVLALRGYRYQFYPGESYRSVEYVNQQLIDEKSRLHWIYVFLSIEKKTSNKAI